MQKWIALLARIQMKYIIFFNDKKLVNLGVCVYLVLASAADILGRTLSLTAPGSESIEMLSILAE